MIATLDWLAITVYQEARGEPYQGKLAVAWVIVNRARASGKSISDTVLQPWQFSCWNTESATRKGLQALDATQYAECERAARAALEGTESDPTSGALHYLNEAVVLKTAGKLPVWFDPAKVTARIARHTFLRL